MKIVLVILAAMDAETVNKDPENVNKVNEKSEGDENSEFGEM